MKLRRTELLEAAGPLLVEADASDFKLENVDVISDRCPAELTITRAGSESSVQGRITVRLKETCDRCLVPFESDLTATFFLLLTEKESWLSGARDPDIYVFPEGEEELDLAPIMTDAILLERPMKHVCRENCQGLCPHCGTNLNEAECSCDEETIDARWEPLKALHLTSSGQ